MHWIHLCIMPGETAVGPVRRRAVTVQRLLDAALETFAEVGFAAASVQDICRRGGFTRGAFYSSFRTKDELFAALYTRQRARDLATAQEQLVGLEQEADPVAAAVARCLRVLSADRAWSIVQVEFALHAARHPPAAALLRAHAEQLDARLAAMIGEVAGRTGLVLAVGPDDLGRAVRALHDGLAVQHLRDADAVAVAVAVSSADSSADGSAGTARLERAALLLLLRGALAPAGLAADTASADTASADTAPARTAPVGT